MTGDSAGGPAVGSDHISIAHAVAFILDDVDLTPPEEAHLLNCQQCQYTVIDATFEELQRRKDEGAA